MTAQAAVNSRRVVEPAIARISPHRRVVNGAMHPRYRQSGGRSKTPARELDVSENVLSRVVNGAFTKCFRKLLNDHRVEEATLLLRDTDMQVTQIAFDVGFNSLASFNRVFKETTGPSPTEYRESSAE